MPITRTRGVYALAVTGVAMLALSGCAAGAADDGKTSLTIGFYAAAGSEADSTMRALIDEFAEANPDIDVQVEAAPYVDFFKRLRTQVAGNKAPDVWLSDGVLVQEFAARGSLRDLSEYADDLDPADYIGLDHHRDADDKLWAFPQAAQVPVLYYNKALFAEAGVEPPTDDWTYDDLAAAAQKLTVDKNGDGTADAWGFRAFSPGFTESWWPQVRAFGGEIVNEDRTKVTVDSPESAAALEWVKKAIDPKTGFAPDVVTTSSLGSPHELFANQTVAMSFGIYARAQAALAGNVDFDVVRMPTGPGGNRGEVSIVNAWAVNAKSSDAEADAAWKWIEFFSGEKPQTAWAALGEGIPINHAVASSDAFLGADTAPANRQAFLDGMEDAEDMGENAVWSEYTNFIGENVTSALSGSMDIEDALADAQKKAQESIDRFQAAKG
ncbi:sugar ABC transporter substrate-binding protein [Microbacterium sp. ARD32]|uniref:ABC transporter substrate-binding protein n=1 Tax=Microbacterium sp. ARD32 TaxID=2962577 RepID=UPI0028817F53|nr:sugar ABC transporter substrate-binding protein [Microbacterium sp. ARD32]MDT0157665.1 sugar ABC transporter substrate-binding protein [Microbacterium sp. ARD32]